MSLIHRSQRGFTTVTLMGVLLVGGLLVTAGFAAVDPDISLSRQDQDNKQAYGAAEAGLQWYLSRLGQDNSFYVHCTDVDPPNPSETAPVNQKWDETGSDDRVWRKLPGEDASYTVELMPAPGFAQCIQNNQYSMIDPSGNMKLRISGKSRGEVRTVLATLRRQNFLDFIYFTDYETSDPGVYANTADSQRAEDECSTYRDDRTSFCQEIQFAAADFIKGPLHTNDNLRVCKSPTFGRNSRDAIEIVGTPAYETSPSSGCSPGAPNYQGTLVNPASAIGMPPSNSELANIAETNYRFFGRTTIILNGESMTVYNQSRFGSSPQSMSLPDNGVIYVGNGSCTSGFTRSQTYPANVGCGDVWVSGNYGRDLTIAAANDVVINDDLQRSSGGDGLLLGLVANNFVRVYHPVQFTSSGSDVVNGCRNTSNATRDLVIHAAILALNHSFIHDNWHCGQPLGNLNIHGAIAQRYRGPVGTGSGSSISTGFLKQYEYNDRLRYREPPYFLDPEQAAWRISRETEQERAVKER